MQNIMEFKEALNKKKSSKWIVYVPTKRGALRSDQVYCRLVEVKSKFCTAKRLLFYIGKDLCQAIDWFKGDRVNIAFDADNSEIIKIIKDEEGCFKLCSSGKANVLHFGINLDCCINFPMLRTLMVETTLGEDLSIILNLKNSIKNK
jgi:hypothetical protein